MNYQEALDYLYSFMDYERRPATTPAEAAFNLARMEALLAAVGRPHDALASVVVAGTKGKGSTCAMVEAIARAAGYRTGLWTSPHLHSYRERIQVNREPISQADLAAAVDRLRPAIEAFDQTSYGAPTTFEIGFALALRHFAEQGARLAVLEVGLGGRYDSANVVVPLVSAISSISYDHMRVLGSTLAEIADNKAGIMKAGVPCVTVPQPAEAAAVLARVAAEEGAPLWLAQELQIADYRLQLNDLDRQSTIYNLRSAIPYPVEPAPGQLRGAFQRENARLALGTALLLRARGLAIGDAAMARGLATAAWPGRLELAGTAPLLVLDGAHNGDSARKLVAALDEEFRFERLILVLGTSRDKDIAAIVSALAPRAAALVLTRSHHPRAQADLDQLAAAVAPYLRGPLALTPDVPTALSAARSYAGPSDLICITGSLFVVGAAREALGLAESD